MESGPNRWGMDFQPVEEYIGDGIRFGDHQSVAREQGPLPLTAKAALAGLLAVIPMTVVMLLGQKQASGKSRPLPPEKVTANAVEKLDLDQEFPPYSSSFQRLFLIGHFGYGSITGALYPFFSNRFPRVRPMVKGMGFGLLIWALSYPGWIPAVGLWRRSKATSKENSFSLILSHLVWGASLSLVDYYQGRGAKASTSTR